MTEIVRRWRPGRLLLVTLYKRFTRVVDGTKPFPRKFTSWYKACYYREAARPEVQHIPACADVPFAYTEDEPIQPPRACGGVPAPSICGLSLAPGSSVRKSVVLCFREDSRTRRSARFRRLSLVEFAQDPLHEGKIARLKVEQLSFPQPNSPARIFPGAVLDRVLIIPFGGNSSDCLSSPSLSGKR